MKRTILISVISFTLAALVFVLKFKEHTPRLEGATKPTKPSLGMRSDQFQALSASKLPTPKTYPNPAISGHVELLSDEKTQHVTVCHFKNDEIAMLDEIFGLNGKRFDKVHSELVSGRLSEYSLKEKLKRSVLDAKHLTIVDLDIERFEATSPIREAYLFQSGEGYRLILGNPRLMDIKSFLPDASTLSPELLKRAQTQKKMMDQNYKQPSK